MSSAPAEHLAWTDKNFESMSWHDNHVHALRIAEGPHGAGELAFDVDYILNGCKVDDGFQFEIIPATLVFHQVYNLRIALDYQSRSAALTPFSIHDIVRRREPRERHVAQVWNIAVNWPAGDITFEASGFTQTGKGPAVVTGE